MEKELYSKAESASVDAGLRSYMQKIYNFMAGGLCVTGLAAWIVANTSLITLFFNITPQSISLSGLGWVAFLAPLVMVFAFGWFARFGSFKHVQLFFGSYAVFMGV